MADIKQKIVPSLWFDTECEEAINFYIDVFNGSPNKDKESKIVSIMRYEKGMEAPGAEQMEGKIITAIFELAGQRFMALDGGPIFKFNESVSFYVECEDQAETDYFWNKLSAVTESEQCGWLKDKFSLSWQIVPRQLGELMNDPDKEKSLRVMNAMLQMKKIDVAELQKAYDGE
jgi:predicted 3-demethylubiquinone-9 3-methyltransferase (glyoxalase superfamily)